MKAKLLRLFPILLLPFINSESYTDYDYINDENNLQYIDRSKEPTEDKTNDLNILQHINKSKKPTDGKTNDLNDDRLKVDKRKDPSDHVTVTDSYVFPYMAVILKESKFISSGAIIHESWVISNADGLFLIADSIRLIRVRLGSINYKKGGLVTPIKLLEIHPFFDDNTPNFDIALLMLAKPVRYTQNLRPIRLQTKPGEVGATHFIVTSWPGPLENKTKNSTTPLSMETIKRHRMLTVQHLHPSDPDECNTELKEMGASRDGIMCLDPALNNPCSRDIGAPVVLNHVLWAVISSWKPDDCKDHSSGPMFATLISAQNVSNWIQHTVHGHSWTLRPRHDRT